MLFKDSLVTLSNTLQTSEASAVSSVESTLHLNDGLFKGPRGICYYQVIRPIIVMNESQNPPQAVTVPPPLPPQ